MSDIVITYKCPYCHGLVSGGINNFIEVEGDAKYIGTGEYIAVFDVFFRCSACEISVEIHCQEF